MAEGVAITPSDMSEARRIMMDMDKPQKRTIRAADYLSVKNSLPKTFVSHTIIHENPSQDRLLGMELDRIGHRKTCYLSTHEISRRTFLEKQTRKERKWKSQDEMRISGMNFPTLRASAISGRASVDVMYKSPKYQDGENKPTEPMLPYMRMRRERTEFIRHHGVLTTTRLPTVIEIDAGKLQRYNTFCGQGFKRLKTRKIQRDKKLLSLLNSLSPLKTESESVGKQSRPWGEQEEIDRSRPWYMSDSDSESEEETPIRGLSRDSRRKSVVVFPTVPKSNKVQDKYATPIQTESSSGHTLSDSRRPSLENRAQTNYDLKKPSIDKRIGLATLDETPPPKTAPNISSLGIEGFQSPTKFVDIKQPIITQLDEKNAQQNKIRNAKQGKARKGILKSPTKGKRTSDKESNREKIRKDLQSKDLRELMSKYGHLNKSSTDKKPTQADPRDNDNFHSPTLERRFQVKSGNKYS